MVDTGIMRKNEFKDIYKLYKDKYQLNKINKCIKYLFKKACWCL